MNTKQQGALYYTSSGRVCWWGAGSFTAPCNLHQTPVMQLSMYVCLLLGVECCCWWPVAQANALMDEVARNAATPSAWVFATSLTVHLLYRTHTWPRSAHNKLVVGIGGCQGGLTGFQGVFSTQGGAARCDHSVYQDTTSSVHACLGRLYSMSLVMFCLLGGGVCC